MRNLNFRVFIICSLFFIGCDFADDKLSLNNKSLTNIIVETKYFEENSAIGVRCTRNFVEKESTQILELLNRNWDMYFIKEKREGFLQVTIVLAPESDISFNSHFHNYFEDELSRGNYSRSQLNYEELEEIGWQLSYQ